MKPVLTRSALLSLALATGLAAEETVATVSPPDLKPAESTEPAQPTSAEDLQKAELEKEKDRLALENALADERVKRETAELRTELARLRAEKELMAERLAYAAVQRQADNEAEAAKMETEKARLEREAALAKARAEALAHELKAVQAESTIEVTRLQGEIQRLEMTDKRHQYADAGPQYLAKPLQDDGTLIISDRRIPLNGPITTDTADEVTDRIHYFNNQNREHPIFIVIDECPGGSVMAGYRILKAMDASEAPVHVVVKSFAASMAASIATLAEESYAYPNAVILHHQISTVLIGRLNLTQQEEFVKESQRWWTRLATPIADKMGITTDEFIKRMYEHSSSGDWSEFGSEALRLKWVNHIVTGIHETSFRRSPDATPDQDAKTKRTTIMESLDPDGHPVMYLPRINPKDVYFLYNPDGYYQVR